MLLIMIDDFRNSVVKKKFNVKILKDSFLIFVIKKLTSVVFHNGLCSKQHWDQTCKVWCQ